MNKEQKELLLQDLCGRLPYGVKVKVKHYEGIFELRSIHENGTVYLSGETVNIEDYFENCKPYLFPLSSMTEEQKKEFFDGTPLELDKYGDVSVKIDSDRNYLYTDLEIYLEVINRLLKNHFDIYGLIPMGLAENATDKNIY